MSKNIVTLLLGSHVDVRLQAPIRSKKSYYYTIYAMMKAIKRLI